MNISTPYITDAEQLALLNSRNTGRMKYTFMNDFLSKYGFQKDLYALRGLLAALLHIDFEDITNITILNPVEPGKNITDKECILDIKLELNHSTIINIEIQSKFQLFWPERSLTYLCKNFDQLDQGSPYFDIKPCIHIGILAHDLFKKDDPRYTGDFYSEYKLLHSSKHTEYSSKFEIIVLSLNQLENASDEEKDKPNGLYHWAKMFKASSWEEVKMIAQDNPMISSFVGTVMELTADEKVSQIAEMRRRYSNDIASYEYEVAQAKEMAEVAGANEAKAREDAIKAIEDASKAREDASKAREDAAKAREDAAKAREDAAKAKKESQQLQATYTEALAGKDAEIARLQRKLAQK